MLSIPMAAATARELADACGEDPGILCREVLDRTDDVGVARAADFILGKPLTILAILLGAWIVNRLARRAIRRGLRRLASGTLRERFSAARRRTPSALVDTEEVSVRSQQRVEALATVLRSVVSFAIWTLALFLVLGEVGINLGPLIAGAGIIGVALGFGSQSLVRDFLSGIFILVEDQYGVGDIVDLGEASGVVEVVSLRTTRIRSVDGTVWHVPNGAIPRVGNMSQHWSRALVDVQVAHGTDVAAASAIMERVAGEVARERAGWVLDAPEVWGVEELGPHGLSIRLVLKTMPSRQYEVSRLLRERIHDAFRTEGIELAYAYGPTLSPTPGAREAA